MTALAFIEIAQAAGCKTIVHTAAASVLGLMLIRHAKRVGVNVIAVCRKKEQLDACSAAGALEVVDSTSENFHATLTELCKKHNATVRHEVEVGNLT
jgi:NADPH:quinone reductase-like Zn-dependent oxidoreductase